MYLPHMLIAIILCVVGGAIGWTYSQRLVKRRKYFEQLSELLVLLSADVGFAQSDVATLLKRYRSDCGTELSRNLDEYLRFVGGETPEPDISRHLLTDSEFIFIKAFFSALGRYDLFTQLRLLERDKMRADEFLARSRERETRQASSAIKLGALLGLMVGIVIL